MKNSSFILTLLFCSLFLVLLGGANYSSSNNSVSNPTTPRKPSGIVQVAKLENCEIANLQALNPSGFPTPSHRAIA